MALAYSREPEGDQHDASVSQEARRERNGERGQACVLLPVLREDPRKRCDFLGGTHESLAHASRRLPACNGGWRDLADLGIARSASLFAGLGVRRRLLVLRGEKKELASLNRQGGSRQATRIDILFCFFFDKKTWLFVTEVESETESKRGRFRKRESNSDRRRGVLGCIVQVAAQVLCVPLQQAFFYSVQPSPRTNRKPCVVVRN